MTFATWSETRSFLRIATLCLIWYAVSSANGVLGKWILSEFPHPMSLTTIQLLSITLYSRPLLALLGVREMAPQNWGYSMRRILPLALFKFVSSVLGHVSIWKVAVSFAHTIKASMPLFTVVLSRILLGQRVSWAIYVSLLPIVLGVALATVSELAFDPTGLAAALGSTAGFSVITIMTKKVLADTGVHSLRLLLVLGQLSLLMFLPVWLWFDLGPALKDLENSSTAPLIALMVLDGLCHWLQNIVAFTLMRLVNPLTYSVANVTKRIAVICVSLLMLKNPVTVWNVTGMGVAIAGVFLYNKTKLDEKHARESLPTTSKAAKVNPIWNGNHNQSHVTIAPPMPMINNGYNRLNNRGFA